MNISPDDPEITAFALGEIEDAERVEQIEAAVAASPELREAVDAIRETGAAIEEALAAEPAPEWTEAEKSALRPSAAWEKPAWELPPQVYKSDGGWKTYLKISLKAAAAIAVFGFIASVFIPTVGRVREQARRTPEQMQAHREQQQRMIDSYYASQATPRRESWRAPRRESWNTDAFDPIEESVFRSPAIEPLSTFSIDVDTASYAKVREFLTSGRLPPASAVRIEELINYFPYSDPPPSGSPEEGGDPFAVHLEQATAPWAPDHRLLRVNLKGYEIPWTERSASNLVFLLDVSGSMRGPNRLPLVKESLRLLVDRLDERDRVAIVTYAGGSETVLPSTTANNKQTIRHAIDRLQAGGSTNAGSGIERAYATAREHFIEDGNNRVILCTDGDFNIGVTDRGQLGSLAREHADAGVSLTVLGFGMGNYKDNMLEELSEKGKGTYAYIDSGMEARKFFLQEVASNLFTIARDVKIQVEFNPAEVQAYRLIGYENRALRAEEFNDDATRAGDIGPGHTVTAFYEIIPPGVEMDRPDVDPLRYQRSEPAPAGGSDGELATVKVRFKRPGTEISELLARTVPAERPVVYDQASEDFRFGAAVAAFGMRLRNSEQIGDYSWREIRDRAAAALGRDDEGYRAEFLQLVSRAASMPE